jgi:hypothetical protein
VFGSACRLAAVRGEFEPRPVRPMLLRAAAIIERHGLRVKRRIGANETGGAGQNCSMQNRDRSADVVEAPKPLFILGREVRGYIGIYVVTI